MYNSNIDMNDKKYSNLKPWKPGQSGNPAGRKSGSKNISTIVSGLLERELSDEFLTASGLNHLLNEGSNTFAEAVVMAAIQKALQGNMQAIIWLTEQQSLHSQQTINNVREREQPLITSLILPRNISAVD